MTDRLTRVMISSTILDLPLHRLAAKDACIEEDMLPLMMEHWPAGNEDVIEMSMNLVDRCDIYVCIVGSRYGVVPPGREKSVTHMEYERAVELGKERLIFIMDKDHVPWVPYPHKPQDRLQFEAFKKTLLAARFVKFFKSVDGLKHEIGKALAGVKRRWGGEGRKKAEPPPPGKVVGPKPPRIVHPYTLWQEAKEFVGREAEVEHLNEWVSNPSASDHGDHVLGIVAIGGEGKSALTWKWFNDLAPGKMKPLAGRFWWSFYDDADIKNFITRAYCYVTGHSTEQAREISADDREEKLLEVLASEPYLFVLDGFERVLVCYAEAGSAHARDAEGPGLPEGGPDSFARHARMRKTMDPAAGIFLRHLLCSLRGGQSARFLITTRVYPADLEDRMSRPLAGCSVQRLGGLSDHDALALWPALGCEGTRESLLKIFNSFGNHALLIHVLAGAVANYTPAPGDFDRWRQDNPDFDPRGLPLRQRETHVLSFATRALGANARRVLHHVTVFHTPASYDALAAILVGEGKPFAAEAALSDALNDLVNRSLLGWDRADRRYDMHPLVREHVWGDMDEPTRRETFEARLPYFKERPVPAASNVQSPEDLNEMLELYYTYIGLKHYDMAAKTFTVRLGRATLYRLSASRLGVRLLEPLFTDGPEQPPPLKEPALQSRICNFCATAYFMSGQLGEAAGLYRRQIRIDEQSGAMDDASSGWGSLAEVLRLTGDLREAEAAARRALVITREHGYRLKEAGTLRVLGSVLTALGRYEEALKALERARRIFGTVNQKQPEGLVCASLAHLKLLWGRPQEALQDAACALELAGKRSRFERDYIRAIRLQGQAELALGHESEAAEYLRLALKRARAVGWVREEIPAAAGLAELARRKRDFKAARALLEEIWEAAERGPYRLSHAHARNILAQVERDADNPPAAAEAAKRAYELASCDGPPFDYRRGMEAAKAHLSALGVPPPQTPPYAESRYEPMPDVEIDPPDEFRAEGGGERGRG
jgi:tetratricopeptide (TPR) repeat protein